MNGTARKSLATQLDRFDTMLEGLSEAIPDAVADAVRVATQQAVREAVEAAVKEVLTNPQIREKLMPTTEQKPTTTMWNRVKQMWQGVRSTLSSLHSACTDRVQRVCESASNLRQRILWLPKTLQVVKAVKGQVVTAVGVGLVVAVVALVAGPYVAAVLSGIGGFGSTLAVQGGLWLRRMVGGQTVE